MKNMILLFVLMFLIPIASADTLNDAFNGSYTATASFAYGDSISLPEGYPDYIEIRGVYPEYAPGYPYLNNLAYYELDTGAEDTTGSHDGSFNGIIAGTFDGIDDYVSIPAHSDFNTTDFTISALVNIDDLEQKLTVFDAESYAIRITQAGTPYVEVMDDVAMTETSMGSPRGTSYYILSMIEYKGELYAGLYSGYVYKYTGGTSWTSCGQVGSSTSIFSLVSYNGNLYAGGGNGAGLSKLYRYDGGTTWTYIGATTSASDNYIDTMCSYDGKLFLGTDSGQVNYYDGSIITDCSIPGTTYTIRAMAVYKDKLYVSGSGDGVVYRWDGGSTWTSIGDIGACYHINDLAVYNDELYATLSGSTLSGYCYKWNGVGTTTWTSCGRLGSSSENRALCVYNGKLYGSVYSYGNIYRYDGGTTWTAEGLTDTTRTYCLQTFDGKLVVGCYNKAYVYSIGTGEAIYGDELSACINYILTATKKSGTLTFHINDVLQGTTTASYAVSTDSPIYIGKSQGTSSPSGSEECFDGQIHNVGYWNDDTSAYAIYLDGSGLFCKPSSDTVYVPYEGMISIGGIIDGITLKNTDGTATLTIIEYFIESVETRNEVNNGGVYEVDIQLTTNGYTTDGTITIPVDSREFIGASVTGDSTEISYNTGYLYIDTDTLDAGTHNFHVEATYDIGYTGTVYSPTSNRIEMVALSGTTQEFTVVTNDETSHDFVWSVDNDEVQSDYGYSSSYTYESLAYGSYIVKVAIDDSIVHTWTVVNGLDTNATTRSIQNLNNFNLTYKQIDEYPGISTLMSVDENNTSAMIEALFIPVTHYWMDDAIGIGSWIYVVIVILTVGITYIKTKRLETTSMVLLIMSLMVAAPATAGTIVIPAAVTYLMYICVILSIVGIFGGLLMGDNQ